METSSGPTDASRHTTRGKASSGEVKDWSFGNRSTHAAQETCRSFEGQMNKNGFNLHQTRRKLFGVPPLLGFTLIELLIIITILAILASILFPVFGKARERARSTKCSANLRQVGVALRMYTDDNDGFGPPVEGREGTLVIDWPWLLFPYQERAPLCMPYPSAVVAGQRDTRRHLR